MPRVVRRFAHFDRHLIALAGDWPLQDVSIGHLLWLRAELRKRTSDSNRNRGKTLSPKTIRNIVDGSLRALCRDARRIDGLKVDLQAFEDMEWPKLRWSPTPFTEEERDKILGWYASRVWRVPGSAKRQVWPTYYAYVYTLFFTGCRPSELSAVRVRSVNLNAGTIRILESIDDGHVGDVKTQSSDRTARLTPENTKLLRDLLELRPDPNAFFFRDVHGEPINGGAFYNSFVEAQRALGISPIRDLYSTKDTFMSVCMSNGVDLSWLSAQTGVSEWTIKKHYGRYMNHPDRDAMELAKIRPPAAVTATDAADDPVSRGAFQRAARMRCHRSVCLGSPRSWPVAAPALSAATLGFVSALDGRRVLLQEVLQLHRQRLAEDP